MAPAGGRGPGGDAPGDRLGLRRLRAPAGDPPLAAAAAPGRGAPLRLGRTRPGPRRTGEHSVARPSPGRRGLRVRHDRPARTAARRDHADHPSAAAGPGRAHRSPAAVHRCRRAPRRSPGARRPVHHGHLDGAVGAGQRAARAPAPGTGLPYRHHPGDQRRVPALHRGRRVPRGALVAGEGLGPGPRAGARRAALLAPRGRPVAAAGGSARWSPCRSTSRCCT